MLVMLCMLVLLTFIFVVNESVRLEEAIHEAYQKGYFYSNSFIIDSSVEMLVELVIILIFLFIVVLVLMFVVKNLLN